MGLSKLLFAFVLLAPLTACDKVDNPYEQGSGGNNSGNLMPRKVLLEDMTGHTCNNCPDGARKAMELKNDLYHDDLIVVGVHCTETFAAPLLPLNDNYFDTDFRTTAGTEYEGAFGIFFLPTGMVSRRDHDNSVTVAYDDWGAAISTIIGTPSPYHIWFDTLEENGGNLNTTVKLALLEAVSGDVNLTIYLTEDSVVDWQIDNDAVPPEVPNYMHRHVLRANVNGTWGVPVITGSALAGDTITLEYSNFPLDPAWNTAHCALVAYVYNVATDEVLQVEEREFEP